MCDVRRHGKKVTREMPSSLDDPVGRTVESVVVTGSQVDDHEKKLVARFDLGYSLGCGCIQRGAAHLHRHLSVVDDWRRVL